MSAKSSIEYRPEIDGLRALAVLLVLVFHTFPELCPFGFIGVDFFFVISGFLITGIIKKALDRESFSFLEFYVRRTARLFPVLLVVLAVALVAGYCLFLPSEFSRLCSEILGGVLYVSNFIQWADSSYFDVASDLKPLLHLWSLGIEEQFYFVWPFAVWLTYRFQRNLLGFISFCLLVASFSLNIVFVSKLPSAVFYMPFFRIWEFLVGSLLSLYQEPLSRFFYSKKIAFVSLSDALSGAGLLLLIFASLLIDRYSIFPGILALIPVLSAGLLILAGSDSRVNRRLFSNRVVVAIGLISYPIYLWHWPILSFLKIASGSISPGQRGLICLVVTPVLSWISYRYIERPLRHSGKPHKTALSLVGVSAVIGIFAFFGVYSDGFPNRSFLPSKDLPLAYRDLLKKNFGGEVEAQWRHHKCFLGRDDDVNSFSEECVRGSSPFVLLWGDSHAAALYPGLQNLSAELGFSVAQRTASLCPISSSWDNPQNRYCKDINESNFDLVTKLKPSLIVIQAQWVSGGYNLEKVLAGIDRLRSMTSTRILVIGAAPQWNYPGPKVATMYFEKYGRIPLRTEFQLMQYAEGRSSDKFWKTELSKRDIPFTSLLDTLCEDNQCLLFTKPSAEYITTFDQGHLSPAASIEVSLRLKEEFAKAARVLH